jgi:hypothetical protein
MPKILDFICLLDKFLLPTSREIAVKSGFETLWEQDVYITSQLDHGATEPSTLVLAGKFLIA